MKIERICKTCKSKFHVFKYRANTAVFCSHKCRRPSELAIKMTTVKKTGIPSWNKGIPCRPETKEKLKIAKKGKRSNIAGEFKKGLIPWNKGKKGLYTQTEEWKENQRLRISGEKHHHWKGGITPLVERIRKCFKYRQWRSDNFTRDDYTCQICSKRGGTLHVDHYPKMFSEIMKENNIRSMEQALECEELWNINNGRTLCHPCHYFVTYGKKYIPKKQ